MINIVRKEMDGGCTWDFEILPEKDKTMNTAWLDLSETQTKLVYSRYGVAYSDDQAKKIALKLKSHPVTSSTENVINEFRLLIKQGVFKCDEVDVFFVNADDEYIPVRFYSDGGYDQVPGFCDRTEEILLELLKTP